jgi:hypothetical protein
MDVKELTQNQLDCLKVGVYYMRDDELIEQFKDVLNDEIIIDIKNSIFPCEISNETIYTLFSGIDFVYDDFGFE